MEANIIMNCLLVYIISRKNFDSQNFLKLSKNLVVNITVILFSFFFLNFHFTYM